MAREKQPDGPLTTARNVFRLAIMPQARARQAKAGCGVRV
jgi:hypothetical protein